MMRTSVYSHAYFPFPVACRLQVGIDGIQLVCADMDTFVFGADVPVVQFRNVLIDIVRVQVKDCRHLRHHSEAAGDIAPEACKLRKVPLGIDTCVSEYFAVYGVIARDVEQLGCTDAAHQRQPVSADRHGRIVFRIERQDIRCRDFLVRSGAAGC